MKQKRIAFVEDYLYLKVDEDNILKLDLEGNILQTHCDSSFLNPSAPEQELSDPSVMTLGIIGEGCGGNRVFIADTQNNTIEVFNLEDESSMTLIENLNAPDGICKVMCTLYISSIKDNSVIVFDISKMESEKITFRYNNKIKK